MEGESCIPPGFRFHPTEEELVGYYLARKVADLKIDLDVITDVDLYRIEPWDLQEKCKLGYEEQTEWYFFSHKDKKYPTGTRTNRATAAGFWKATGRDKAVFSKFKLIGMRKTLVFYKGRAPNGRKTDWIIHEYRLETNQHGEPQDEGWVVCRAFRKQGPCQKPNSTPTWGLGDHIPAYISQVRAHHPAFTSYDETNHSSSFPGGIDNFASSKLQTENQFFNLPQLESSSFASGQPYGEPHCQYSYGSSSEGINDHNGCHSYEDTEGNMIAEDWRPLDNHFSSYFSQDPSDSGGYIPFFQVEKKFHEQYQSHIFSGRSFPNS